MLTEDAKARARHHLGYLQTSTANMFALGVPANVQTTFQIEAQLNLVLPSGEPKFYRLLDILDALESQMVCDAELLAVTQVGTIQVRPDEFVQLLKQYQHWQSALGNLLGIQPNQYDQRFANSGINARVHT